MTGKVIQLVVISLSNRSSRKFMPAAIGLSLATIGTETGVSVTIFDLQPFKEGSGVFMISTVSTAFADGGIWMWLILAAQISSVAIIIERVYALYLNRKPNQRELAAAFESDIRKGQLDRVISRAQAMGRTTPIAVVAQTGAQAALDLGGKEEIQLKIDEVLIDESNRLESRTGFLAMIGNVATLLGLLGTIVGLIKAFASVSSANATEKAALLSQGVSEAMYTTAYGLIAALPALLMYAVLQNRANQLSDDLQKAALKLYILLGFNYEAVPQTKKKSS